MRLTLFSRLLFGYLAILILIVAVSLYALIQLGRFNGVTRSLLEVDTRIIDLERKLSDALLSQIRYERKFVLSRDDVLYDQFLLFKSDFEQYMGEALSLAGPPVLDLLKKIQEDHQRYQKIFFDEVKYLKAGLSYPQAQYQKEKERAVDATIAELERLRDRIQRQSYTKVKDLAEAGSHARRMAMVITGVTLFLVLAISLLITRSITGPISLLKEKTRAIARGHFEGEVNLSSPPEMAELAGAFNRMCRQLRDLDKMKADFFSSVSHELRTPLASIKEGVGLLRDGVGGSITEKQKQLLAILTEESSRLIGMVNSLLDVSKMEVGMMSYRFEPASLSPLIHRVTAEIAPLVEAKRIRLETSITGELPTVRVDSERILQALRNLVGNAVKFTPEGGQITISAKPTDGKVEVSVTDTGAGIPAENLTTIFEKYRQGTPAGSYRIKGTGLGLTIVKHIVTSHGGRVWAESEPGKGSTFTFILPA